MIFFFFDILGDRKEIEEKNEMFLYENKDAVGQCQSCGKGLCKDCLTEYNGICQDCYFDNKAEQIDGDNQNMVVVLTEYKRNIISTLIKGGIGSALLGIVAAMLVPLSSLSFMNIDVDNLVDKIKKIPLLLN